MTSKNLLLISIAVTATTCKQLYSRPTYTILHDPFALAASSFRETGVTGNGVDRRFITLCCTQLTNSQLKPLPDTQSIIVVIYSIHCGRIYLPATNACLQYAVDRANHTGQQLSGQVVISIAEGVGVLHISMPTTSTGKLIAVSRRGASSAALFCIYDSAARAIHWQDVAGRYTTTNAHYECS